jgi:hypothetical protein
MPTASWRMGIGEPRVYTLERLQAAGGDQEGHQCRLALVERGRPDLPRARPGVRNPECTSRW